ncbi:hypothetical protein AZZ66_003734, partial [Escherichia coli]
AGDGDQNIFHSGHSLQRTPPQKMA